MENKPIETEEYRKLREKYNSISKYYLELVEQRETIVFKEKVYFESKYISIFGYILRKKLELETELKRVKKKIALMQFYFSYNHELNIKEVEARLKEEMVQLDKNCSDFQNKITQSRVIVGGSKLTEEERKELRTTFKIVAAKLHPDLNKNGSLRELNLWNRALDSYKNNDLCTLKLISNILNSDNEVNCTESIEILRQHIKMIRTKTNDILNEIENIKKDFPFSVKNDLDDKSWRENEKNSIRSSIKELEELLRKYKVFLKAFEEEFKQE